MGRFEDVLEYAAEIDPGRFIRKDGHCSIAEIQRPDVIKAEDVVNVAMRYQYRVEPPDICAKRLLAEIGRGIDKDGPARMLDEDRDAEALIARIVRKARPAITRDRGNAGRGACT
jgi:hypothetical protein